MLRRTIWPATCFVGRGETSSKEPLRQEVILVQTLIIFCLANVEPSACTFETALYRVNGPPAGVEQCAFSGQAILAAQPHAILGNQYAKVMCESPRHAHG